MPSIWGAAGAPIHVPALQQVLHGRLLTGRGERFLRPETDEADGSATEQPLSWAPAKISGRYLAPYLVANNVVALPSRGTPDAGIDVFVPLTRRQKRARVDVLGLSPLGVIARR